MKEPEFGIHLKQLVSIVLIASGLVVTSGAQDFGITGDILGTNFYLEYECSTDSY